MAAGWFRKLTVAGPAVFKQNVTLSTGTLTAKSLNSGSQTVATTASTVAGDARTAFVGITGATADKVLNFARPTAAGVVKSIICTSTGTQKLSLTVNGSTASGFLLNTKVNVSGGSTCRTIVFSSKSTQQRSILLAGASTSVWAVVYATTGVTFAG